MSRRCAYCGVRLPAGKRRDARYCNPAHRLAAHRTRTFDGAAATVSGHHAAAITHLIGSTRNASPLTRTAQARPPLEPMEWRTVHNPRTRTVRPRDISRRVDTPRATGGTYRPATLTPAGQNLVALVPEHDHRDRLCPTCMTARVAVLAPRSSRAQVDPIDVRNALELERGNVARVARLFGISERHVRRIRSGYRPAGGVDADAVAAVIREDGGELGRAVRAFGISWRHAQRIRQGWRPGGRQVPPIPWASGSGHTHLGRNGAQGYANPSTLDYVGRKVAAARRAVAAAATRERETERVRDAVASIQARAAATRARVLADLAAQEER